MASLVPEQQTRKVAVDDAGLSMHDPDQLASMRDMETVDIEETDAMPCSMCFANGNVISYPFEYLEGVEA